MRIRVNNWIFQVKKIFLIENMIVISNRGVLENGIYRSFEK